MDFGKKDDLFDKKLEEDDDDEFEKLSDVIAKHAKIDMEEEKDEIPFAGVSNGIGGLGRILFDKPVDKPFGGGGFSFSNGSIGAGKKLKELGADSDNDELG